MSFIVTRHVHEKDAGLYRLVVSRDVTPANLYTLEDGEEAERVLEFAFDVLFDADDDRWHTGQGRKRKRLPDERIAQLQRGLVKEQLERAERERKQAALESNVRDLPGAGDPL